MPEQGAVKSYDLIVIGTGDAGKTVATAAAREGWRVAIIEKKEVGGTCALWGCVPKKILLTGAEIVHFSRRMAAAGINTGPSVLSWQELMTYKNRLTASYSADDAGQLRALGIDLYRGEARFIGSATVQTAGDTLRGRYVHIASGARPRPLEIPGEEHMITSAEFLYLDSLPPRVIFIGGGFISFEFAHLAARCGSEAVILTRGGRVLKRFDPDLAALLLESSERDGITVALNQQILRIEKTDAGFSVFAESGGRDQEYRADLVVHGAGRVPDIDGLDPEAGGIKASPEGIIVNEFLQSVSDSRVFAAGDAAAGGVPLTPVAMREGEIAANNILHGLDRRRPDYRAVPSVVFTLPKLASAGLQESEARDAGRDIEVRFKETSGWLHNQRMNEGFTGSKIILEKKTRAILGAHILDSHADDLINVFALAMEQGLTAEKIRDVLYAYPTATSSIQYMV